jgi:hypothetical protein
MGFRGLPRVFLLEAAKKLRPDRLEDFVRGPTDPDTAEAITPTSPSRLISGSESEGKDSTFTIWSQENFRVSQLQKRPRVVFH